METKNTPENRLNQLRKNLDFTLEQKENYFGIQNIFSQVRRLNDKSSLDINQLAKVYRILIDCANNHYDFDQKLTAEMYNYSAKVVNSIGSITQSADWIEKEIQLRLFVKNLYGDSFNVAEQFSLVGNAFQLQSYYEVNTYSQIDLLKKAALFKKMSVRHFRKADEIDIAKLVQAEQAEIELKYGILSDDPESLSSAISTYRTVVNYLNKHPCSFPKEKVDSILNNYEYSLMHYDTLNSKKLFLN